jgi:uncharacterized membrane protein
MATAIHQKTVVGVFNSVYDAQQAVRELESEGIPRDEISLVANKNAVGYDSMDAADKDKTADVVADAGIGAAIGGVGGLLLAAAGAVTIPVIGPILAAGPIAAALTGAGIGAAAGGLIGALTESGIPETDAKYYAEGVRRGDVLVTVRADETRVDRVCDVLDRHNAVDVDERVENWQSRGWSGYREDAQPFTEEELRDERRYYGPVGGTVTGLQGIAVDRERARLETEGRPSVPSTEAGNLTGDIIGTTNPSMVGSTGMTSAGLSGTTPSSSKTWDDRSLTEKAGDKMREWGQDVKEKGSELRDEARETSRDMRSSTTGGRMSDAMDEMGRDLKEAGRDVKDFATGRTGNQPHDYAEEAREAERRRRARVYDRY